MIYKAILKHGYSEFIIEILEYCDSKDLINREQYYIDLLKPEYNILKKAGSRLGSIQSEETRARMKGRKRSEETRIKMSSSKAGENHPMFGKLHSKKTLSKMSSSKLGDKNPMFMKKHSEETLAKLVAA